jgi:hypothetical protein
MTTELITDPDDLQVLTSCRETDAHTACTRALKEYLTGLSIDWNGGQLLQFCKVTEDWADVEDIADWPSAAVYTQEPGIYDEDSFSGRITQTPDGYTLLIASEFTQVVMLDVWANTKQTRTGLVAMLEDALDPVEWMSGARLRLPHYHGVHATLIKMSVDYADGTNAAKRWRLAQIQVAVSIPQIRFVGKQPPLKVRVEVDVDDSTSQ